MNLKKIWVVLFLGLFLVTVGTIIIIKLNQNNEKILHNYATTTVIDKYYSEGYAGWYHHKDTEYIIVSETKDNQTITTYVDASTYSHYNIGDTIFYCINHNKLKIYE